MLKTKRKTTDLLGKRMEDGQERQFDAIIVGAGPVGLSCAISLASLGLSIAVLEKQSEEALADPYPDGRDIALTHFSKYILSQLKIFQKINPEAISSIQEAQVLSGSSSHFLCFDSQSLSQHELAFLVSNHLIRKASYETAKNCSTITLIDNISIKSILSKGAFVTVTLKNETSLQGSLLIASDGRFSEVRRQMGISASLQDFGKMIVVCQMSHDLPHHNIAYECFLYGKTLAVLPLCSNRSSIIITASPHHANDLLQMREEQFNSHIEACFKSRLGAMKLDSEKFSYPLVSTYADRFIEERFALIGDAAVGMHPVTAHGFNFGLKSLHTLTQKLKVARRQGLDIGSPLILESYQTLHRRETKPLYLITNAIARLYTDDRKPAKIIRETLLRVANHMVPIKQALVSRLIKTP